MDSFSPTTIFEPFRIKSVEPLRLTTQEQRRAIVKKAQYNLFAVPAEHVVIDLLTDSGTGAMSSLQWAGMMRGDESYAGADSYYRFKETLREVTGFSHILPTHQGRASERILVEVMIGSAGSGAGLIVPNNAHFDTTRANVEHSGARAVDLLTPEGMQPNVDAPFKGNMDISKLDDLLASEGHNVPFVMVTVTCNSAGGQPVSLQNLREVRALCDQYRKPLVLDACRFAENAFFIKEREEGHQERSVAGIVRDTFALADAATISAKKDGLVNIGGVLLFRDEGLFRAASNQLILTEGFVTYGGLAGRDLEAMAVGFKEVLEEDYLRYRIGSTRYLGERLKQGGVGIVWPPGGHAVYVDALSVLPHVPRHELPGQTLAVALYVVGGIRSCEIGYVMFGDRAPMELVRLAIPRRTYTQSHIDFVIETVLHVKKIARSLSGFRITEAPPVLRHFVAKFAPLQPCVWDPQKNRGEGGEERGEERGEGKCDDDPCSPKVFVHPLGEEQKGGIGLVRQMSTG
uniref:Aromatic amino acid beta-eliminating lyase/threonine aldolase domain-containing protein n=1 Tax=Chromera velia CCMP2878 TaxID=1169474 RepID=A0A0G4F085_9ALVE|eukprot:Cvel_14467.t1-p1 / transcript=Cvel_14467.t1 / gene=Cvel_14467 / organism=Chromera_velia_CCMP2878 / gene_product=Tryptophanase, putative / transcript_product=Tryptophanase, putative / location=Cvel_scaffold1030:51117-54754(+) / protein_length=515 / sequence_SO=supercontig / SO=protein_coding / is_pseudo=false